MEKQTTTKIILGLIIFIVFVFQVSSPIQAATTSSISNLYSNPNQSANNTYKFKVSDVVSSGLLTNVVGCTGIVNKVSTWMVKFIQSPAKQAEVAADKLTQMISQLESACLSTKAGVQAGAGATPVVNDLVSTANTIFSKISIPIPSLTGISDPTKLISSSSNKEKICLDQVKAIDPKVLAQMVKDADAEAAKTTKEQCFDGIAITLAKNQLTSMTRSMMNWVNSGYGGNPFFVQNMQDLTNNLERNVLETGIDILLSPGSGNSSPYAQDFASSAVTSSNLLRSSSGLLGNLQSSLENFITDPKSFYTNDQLNQAQITRNALQRAQDANNAFANDFSIGGWNGWLALTQIDQNNPLGFSIQAADELAARQAAQVSQTQNELNQNNGFLSQKTCDEWQVYDTEDGKPKNVAGKGSTVGALPLYQKTKPNKCYKNSNSGDGDCCTHFKIITPGSLIKDKVTNYINSPERQLELAKTINDSLNALFSVLLSKLEGGGLAGLSDASTDATFNWTDNMNTTSDFTSSDGNSTYNNNGAYDGFNLTRDLGNTYIHDTPIILGSWNANTNIATETNPIYLLKSEANGEIKLYPDTAPEVYKVGDLVNPKNGYYNVVIAGNTKLIVDGYNGWAKGDRAFWDGSNWQNWKCGPLNTKGECTVQANPIKQRGVVQIQQDYIVAGKEILGVLPSIMPKLGKLDYCLPGPNPSYKTNSADAQSAYQDWVGSMYVGAWDNTGSRYGVRIDVEGGRTYDNLQNIYADNPGVWNLIKSGMQPLIYDFSNICGEYRNSSCLGNYFLDKGAPGNLSAEGANLLNPKQDLLNTTSDDVNNHLFQDFYTTFDKAMSKLYFNNMVNKYNDTETSIGLPGTENSDYIPMSVTGLDLTKNILYYNDDITKAMQDYTDAMTQAKVNIAKLQPIKDAVSTIIIAAQDRQIANIITALKKLNGSDSYTPSASEIAKYRTDNKACLDEENIQVFDPDTIINGGVRIENCTDGIDNDLNGLVDMADPACIKPSTGTGSGSGTIISTYYNLKSCLDNQSYSTGPYPSGTYSSGTRVQGANFYVVIGSQTTPISGVPNIGTSGTGLSGCPTTGNTGTGSVTGTGTGTTAPTTVSYTVTARVISGNGTITPATQKITVDPRVNATAGFNVTGTPIQWSGNCGVKALPINGRYTTSTLSGAGCDAQVSF